MITPNVELAHVKAARKAMRDLAGTEISLEVLERTNVVVEQLCADVETFDARHVLHQNEQRDSSIKREELQARLADLTGALDDRDEDNRIEAARLR